MSLSAAWRIYSFVFEVSFQKFLLPADARLAP